MEEHTQDLRKSMTSLWIIFPMKNGRAYRKRTFERIWSPDDGLVLDLGCGTGTMTELLAAAGYDMIGIDQSEEMLEDSTGEKAGSPAMRFCIFCQDMREFELYGTVRAIISVCDSMNYITGRGRGACVFYLWCTQLSGSRRTVYFRSEYRYISTARFWERQTIAENREEGSFIWENYYDRRRQINEYDLTLFVERGTIEDFTENMKRLISREAYTLEDDPGTCIEEMPD